MSDGGNSESGEMPHVFASPLRTNMVERLVIANALPMSFVANIALVPAEAQADLATELLLSALRDLSSEHEALKLSHSGLEQQKQQQDAHIKTLQLAFEKLADHSGSTATVQDMLAQAQAQLQQIKEELQAMPTSTSQPVDVATQLQQVVGPLMQQLSAAVAAQSASQHKPAASMPAASNATSSSAGPQAPAVSPVPAVTPQAPQQPPGLSNSGSSGPTAAEQHTAAVGTSGGTGGNQSARMQRLQLVLNSIAKLNRTISVLQWGKQALDTLESPTVQDLIKELQLGLKEQALLLRGRVDQELAGILTGLPLAAHDSPASFIAALQQALPTDELGLKQRLSQMQERDGQSAAAVAKHIRTLYERHRVPMPDGVEAYKLLTSHFGVYAAYLQLSLMSVPADRPYGWSQFEALCAQADTAVKHRQQQQDQSKPAAAQPSAGQQQQQQQQQQHGGRHVRFSPSANGTGYEEGEQQTPSPRYQQQSFHGRGGNNKNRGGRYADYNSSSGGRFGAD